MKAKFNIPGFICTRPSFSKKTWIWRSTKAGNKSKTSGNRWSIAYDIAKRWGYTINAFCSKHEANIYSDHIEVDFS